MDSRLSNAGTPNYCDSVLSDPDHESLLSVHSIATSSSTAQRGVTESQDPTTPAAQAAKAIDLAEDGTWTPATPATPSRPASMLTASSDRHVDAPPDYAQATAQQSPVHSQPGDEESLFLAEDGSATLNLFSHTQKSMGVKRLLRRHWKRLCLLNLAIYCILTTIILIAGLVALRKALFQPENPPVKFDNFPPDHPLNQRSSPETFHQSTPQCQFDTYPSDYYYFAWIDPTNFTFQEDIQPSDYLGYRDPGEISISGNIDVRPAPYGQEDPIEVIISFATTSTFQAGFPEWHKDSETLRIYRSPSPDLLSSQVKHRDLKRNIPSEEKACLDIFVGIYIKTQLDNFSLHTENLHIDIGHSRSYERGWWSFRIRDNSYIHSEGGNITTSNWDSRNANVTSGSGSIKGTYGVNDNLHLQTNSGEIEVDIWQQAAHEKGYLSTHPPNTPANFSTITGSGKQTLRIWQALNPIYWAGILGLGWPFSMRSSHHSDSGSISIESGGYWEGQIHAKSTNGSISLRGKDLHVLPDPTGDIRFGKESNETWARKGSLAGEMLIESREGEISLCTEAAWECEDDYFEKLDVLNIE